MRYQKQIILDEFGFYGQKKLSETKFLCVGAGGLGNVVCLYLSAAGVGFLGIVDNDIVDSSNLQRQIMYNTSQIGQKKSKESARKIKKINPEIDIEIFDKKLSEKNGESIVQKYDVVIDCTDHFESNYLLGDLCVKLNKPLVYASVSGFEGQLAVFWLPDGGCFRCLFQKYPLYVANNWGKKGIFGPVCGVVGSLQALQAIYVALGKEHCKKNNLNILTNQILKVDMKKNEMFSFFYKKEFVL